jgi:hypothetical protein
MHRSGTSALARVVSFFGAKLPAHVMAPGTDNEGGYWEPERLVNLHDEMLAHVGSSWDDWRALDLTGPEFAHGGRYWRKISDIIEQEYGDAPLIVLKDPRMCRFAPFYADLMRALGYEVKFIHAFRDPLAVAASLKQRDGLLTSFSHLLWLRHVLDAEAATRGACRVFSAYRELMADPGACAARIMASLTINGAANVAIKSAIYGFVDNARRHHPSDPAALYADPSVSGWLKGALRSLTALECNVNDPLALAELDRIREAFDAATLHVGTPILAEQERRVALLKDSVDRANARVARLEESLAEKNWLAEQFAAIQANPFRPYCDRFVYRILRTLLRHKSFMTQRFSERLARSAQKRNPLRFAPRTDYDSIA